jgi:curved DNA-binding protein CbpA
VTDPREVLGVSPNAGEEEIRAAYLRKVKEYPPDQAPEEFEKVRNAFETLRDPRKRTLAMLHASDPGAPLASILDGRAPRRLFAGPQPWREVLKAK